MERDLKHEMRSIVFDEEMVNDAYQDAFIKLKKYQEDGNEIYGNRAGMRALFRMTCRNILLDMLRKKQRAKTFVSDDVYSAIDFATPEDELIEVERASQDPAVNKKLERAFKNMNHETFMTYKLRMKGIKFKDIAYLTDCGINTALGRFRYAAQKIENEFTNERN